MSSKKYLYDKILSESEGMHMDTMELGGNIQLTGFSELGRDEMSVVKKMVGSYVKKFMEKEPKFEQLSVVMKPVHKTDAEKLFEIHAKMIAQGNPITAELTDRNLFSTVDSVLKKIEARLD
jgi:ribosome-associated translation inhibitor RaiA